MKKLFFALAGMLALVACGTQDGGPVLTIEGGQIQGVPADIKGVTVYRGIPFCSTSYRSKPLEGSAARHSMGRCKTL